MEEDAPAVLGILSDPWVVEHNPSDLLTELAEVGGLFDRWRQHWREHGFGNCCVVEEQSGVLVGNCGLRRMNVHGQPVLNLMYRFHPSAWGQGYATEAAEALLGWAREQAPGETVLARIRPGNLASQHVALKIGLVRDSLLDDLGSDGLDWAYTNRDHSS